MTAQISTPVVTERELIDAALREAVGRLDGLMHRIAAYHLGWFDEHGRPTAASGKALRPFLVLLSARAAGGDPRLGLPGAVAVELVHSFSLLHDDVMDGDRTRRHRPAAWTVFGAASAILCGDALLALADEVILEPGTRGAHWAARALNAATSRLISGQALDVDFERRTQVSLDECLRMSADKTAALLACASSLGAMLCEAPALLVEALASFGAELGVAFQLTDDLLGIWGAPELTGKPVLNDLRARKKSLPVTAALAAGTEDSARLADLLDRPGDLTEADLRHAARLVEGAGGRAWVEAEAEARVTAARRHLEEADIPDAVRSELLDLAAYVTRRDH